MTVIARPRSPVARALTSLSALVLFALIAGLVVGGLAGGSGGDAAPHGFWISVLSVLESLGQTWLNALRITVMPLIFALLIVGVAAIADAAATGRLAARALSCSAS